MADQPNPRDRADRTVHATIVPISGGRIEIVRYATAGKWWIEDAKTGTRFLATLAEAVDMAAKDRPAVLWHEGRPGGARFDAAVRRARQQNRSIGQSSFNTVVQLWGLATIIALVWWFATNGGWGTFVGFLAALIETWQDNVPTWVTVLTLILAGTAIVLAADDARDARRAARGAATPSKETPR